MKPISKLASIKNVFDRSKRTNEQRNAIRFPLIIRMSVKNLVFKKLRTILTIGGVLIGISAIVFLASLGIGLQRVVVQEVTDSTSIRTIDVFSAKASIVRLDQNNIKRIKELPFIDEVGQGFTFAGRLVYKGSTSDTVVYGVDENYQELSALNLSEGSLIKDFTSNDAVVNVSLLQVLGVSKPEDVIGKELDVTAIRPPKNSNDEVDGPVETKVKVVGVVDSGKGAEVFMANRIFETANTNIYTQLKVVAVDQDEVSELRQRIENLGFETQSSIDTLEQVNQIFRFFTLILVGFGMTGMLIAVLGMLNTLTVSLLERTREIALMVTLGARGKDVRRMFVTEALMLSVTGGICGITLAWITGRAINFTLASIANSRGVEGVGIFYVPWWLTVGIIAFVSLVGWLVVYFPARRAQRINPVDALRNE